MAIKFEFRKEKLVTDSNFFLFKEFTDIWDSDSQNTRPAANKLLKFIYHLCDLGEENPLRDLPSEAKEKEAMFTVYGTHKKSFTKKERNLLSPAIDCYIKYNTTSEERILNAFENKAKEIRTVLDEVIPETLENFKDGVTTFTSNTGIITRGLKELDSLKKLKANVIASVRKEAILQKVRGQVVLSPLSLGNIEVVDIHELYAEYEAKAI